MQYMFSGLLNSYTNYRSREVSNTNTRLGLRRNNSHQNSGSGQEHTPKEHSDMLGSMDKAQVSIESMRCFLEGFLKSMNDELCQEEAKSNNIEIPDMQRIQEAESKCASGTQEAFSAYKQAQFFTGGGATLSSADTKITANNLGMSIDEVRTVFLLIEDLKALETRGMDSLEIERGDTFLGSLVAAVKRVKEQDNAA